MPSRTRQVIRMAEPESFPRADLGHGFGDPMAQMAELVDTMIRPALRRAATLTERFPGWAALATAEPTSLVADDGTPLALAGDVLAGQQAG